METLWLVTLLIFGFLGTTSSDLYNPQHSDIIYYLFNRYTDHNGQVISYKNDSSDIWYFDSSIITYVVAHGFGEKVVNTSWMFETKDLLMEKGDSNVILVDWGALAIQPFYEAAVSNSIFTGKDLATLLHFLKAKKDHRPENTHLIGFSLGCHVVGVTGNEFKGVYRITGLEPAQPQFDSKPLSERLDKSDASFVDVVHTNSGLFITGHLSFLKPLGHVDFYPNGGQDQWGCGILEEENSYSLDGRFAPACNHRRGHFYFTESLKRDNFIGYKCPNYDAYQQGHCIGAKNTLGLSARKDIESKFYMETYETQPYAAYQIKAVYEIDTSTKGSLTLISQAEDYDEKIYTVFQGRVKSGDIYSHVMVAPENELKKIVLKLDYIPRHSQPASIVVKNINGFYLDSGESFCLGRNLTIQRNHQFILPVSKGPCFIDH